MANDKTPRGYESLGQESSVTEVSSYEGINMDTYHSSTKGAQESVKAYPKPDQTKPVRRHHVFRFWPWELSSLLVAFGLIAATYSVLSHFNGQQVPEWPFSINLNTLVALISTIMRAAMLVAVAEVISQTKWSWFSRPRPLSHLQYFDEASRSVSGSLSLLFVAPGSALGVLGALITILSLGIGPFTQQTIKTVPCLRTHNEQKATLPLAHFMPGNGTFYRVGAGSYQVQLDMKGTMVNGIASPTSNDSAIIPTCATGNCTFTSHNGITHSSIGLCSSCIDTTPFINKTTRSNGADNYTLPNNMWVSAESDMVYLNVAPGSVDWASSAFTPEFTSSIDGGLINVTTLSLTTTACSNNGGNLTCPIPDGYGGLTGLVATSCSLYPCLKNYHAVIEKGVLSEKIVSTKPAPVNWVEAGIPHGGISANMNFTAVQRPCLVDGEWYDLPNMPDVPKTGGRSFTDINIDGTNYTVPDECMYKMWFPYANGLMNFMNYDLFDGHCTYNSRQGQAIECDQMWWLASLYNNKEASFDTLSAAFGQFVTAVTNKIRTTGTSNYNYNGHEVVEGAVTEMTVCIEFQWKWLIMPTALVAATAAILIAIITQNLRNHEQPVWKSSLLPLLYYGFRQRAYQEDLSTPVMDLTEMNRAAANRRAKFQNGSEAGFVDVTPSIDDVIRRRGRDVDVDSLIGDR
ncbi:hypothetical protein K449DRAFT_433322 [Hypoxylon sp. EC38]|nr:hypothetical protein K449DRAFT_433322 [Hypoxylon sp. EC38]